MFVCECCMLFLEGQSVSLLLMMLMLTIVNRKNTTLDGTPGKVDPESVKLPPNEDLPPAEVDQDLEEVAYMDREKGDDDEDEVGTEDEGTNYEEVSKTNDDEWDDLANDSAFDDLKMLNVNLKFW